MAERVERLALYETKAVVPLETRSAGVYIQRLQTEGNSLLSSVFVESATGSVLVEYFDYTTGQDVGEAYTLQSHPSLSAFGTNRILITSMHNKPYIKMTVVGVVKFGVYVSVVSTIASDIDKALVFDGHPFVPSVDKGLVIAALDVATNELNFLRTTNGSLNVNITGATSGLVVNTYAESTLAGGATGTVCTYTVPALKVFHLASVSASGQNVATHKVKVNGSNVDRKNLWLGGPMSAEFNFRTGQGIDAVGFKLVAGDVITLETENFRPSSSLFSGRIYGTLV